MNPRPRLLDLFCGAGGAAMGYHRAGFDVIGVDIAPQPRYPFEFHQGDAMTWPLERYDVIHASPPCQDHTTVTRTKHGTGWMLTATIERLRVNVAPFVVENVEQARPSMPGAFRLCGRAFGIAELRRHRLFLVVAPSLVMAPPCACGRGVNTIGVYGDLAKNDRRTRPERPGGGPLRAGIETARRLLDCPWMTGPELSQAIPPVYTEHIGAQLLAHMRAAA
jgi:DNA (cytosine-5)-methyltransferase 1